MSDSSQGAWAIVGKIGALVGVIVGLVTLYNHFLAKEVSVEAQGTCRQFTVPGAYLNTLKSDAFPTYEEIEKLLPEKLADKRLVALDIAKANSAQKSKLNTAAKNLDDVRSFCFFTVSNTGNKEAQEIKFELPREGLYLLDRLGENSKEVEFKKVIPIGKLNPGGKIKIATWNTDSNIEVNSWEQPAFRLTHTNGISEVNFLPENTTILGYLYENYPYFSLILFLCFVVIVIAIGRSMGISEEKERAKKAKLETEKVETKPEVPIGEVSVDVDPPSPP